MTENSQTNKGKNVERKIFTWSDEETALLLHVTLAYKTTKISEGKDWETIRSKYDDILKDFIEQYPKEISEEFPREEPISGEFTKERLNAKLKKIKNSFRKAIDSGKRSGGGRIVCSLYDECHQIWAGSPTADCIAGGLETDSIIPTTVSSKSLDSSGQQYTEPRLRANFTGHCAGGEMREL